MESALPSAGAVRFRARRPLLWWLIISCPLLLWQYHHTQSAKATLRFSISMEGRPSEIPYDATLNGVPYHAGEPCGVGWKKLVITARDAEPMETNVFSWYGGLKFGALKLVRSRGRLEMHFFPKAETVRVSGNEETHHFKNLDTNSLLVPTGQYAVTSKFPRYDDERTILVTRNETTRVAIHADVTALHLTSEPYNAEFELYSVRPPTVAVNGSTPASLADLPIGEYNLVIWRESYRKSVNVKLVKGTSNALTVKFDYARLSFVSDPTNALVRHGDREIGNTPLTIDVQPGRYEFTILKSGYFETNVNLVLSGTDKCEVVVTLGNVSYAEALQRAEQELSSFSPDFEAALAQVEKALQIKPADQSATRVKNQIQVARHLQSARQLQRTHEFSKALQQTDAALHLNASNSDALGLKRELESEHRLALQQQAKEEQEAAAANAEVERIAAARKAEARRAHPQKVFMGFDRQINFNELFETQSMPFNGSIETVRAGLVRAFGRKPEWNVRVNKDLDADTVQMAAEHRGIASKQNLHLILGQTEDKVVIMYFKLFDLALGKDVKFNLGGITEESYVPLHPKYQTLPFQNVEKIRSQNIEAIKNRFRTELPLNE